MGCLGGQKHEPGVGNSPYTQGMLVAEVGNSLEIGFFTSLWA